MIRLYCKGNVIEYTGDGWIQCSRSVACPKKKNNKILGFDCLSYIDNLPENVRLLSPEMEMSKEIKDLKESKEMKEETLPLPSNQDSKEIKEIKDHVGPIITVPSREEIDRKMIENLNKEKQNNEILLDISPLIHLQKEKLVEKAQA